MPAHYFLGTALLGSAPDRGTCQQSFAYFCQRCGEVWGRILCDGASTQWDVQFTACPRHRPTNARDWDNAPGLFTGANDRLGNLASWRWPLALESLPLPVLRREFLILYQHVMEKQS